MRCKEGDMAVIIKDFPSCEANLGVIVKVVGPPLSVLFMPEALWPVVPVSGTKLLAINNDCSGPPELMNFKKVAYVLHPDAWLMPLNEPDRVFFEANGSEDDQRRAIEMRLQAASVLSV